MSDTTAVLLELTGFALAWAVVASVLFASCSNRLHLLKQERYQLRLRVAELAERLSKAMIEQNRPL